MHGTDQHACIHEALMTDACPQQAHGDDPLLVTTSMTHVTLPTELHHPQHTASLSSRDLHLPLQVVWDSNKQQPGLVMPRMGMSPCKDALPDHPQPSNLHELQNEQGAGGRHLSRPAAGPQAKAVLDAEQQHRPLIHQLIAADSQAAQRTADAARAEAEAEARADPTVDPAYIERYVTAEVLAEALAKGYTVAGPADDGIGFPRLAIFRFISEQLLGVAHLHVSEALG